MRRRTSWRSIIRPSGGTPDAGHPTLHATALATFFKLTRDVPAVPRLLRPLAVEATWLAAPRVRSAAYKNGRHLLGTNDPRTLRAYGRSMVGGFYDFVCDVGRYASLTRQQIEASIARSEGHDRYLKLREQCRGAVLVTAHAGSFEVGLAALAAVERKVHVVFKRDTFGTFDQARSDLRRELGVGEIAIDDGWPALMKLREALQNDEVIVMQADRAIPGQRSQRVPFFDGTLEMPLGPVRLAEIAGSPIVPVFTERRTDGTFIVHIDEAIEVDPHDTPVDGVDPALRKIARAIERFLTPRPTQWLVMHHAFSDDRESA